MKLSLQKQERGGVLVVALITCFVIATVLASYLLLISNRYKMTVRSMGWNTAIPVSEAGIEEALTHLQADTNNPSANNWTAATVAGQPVYTKSRNFTDGSYFDVVIHNATATNPIIYSSGFVPAPLRAGYITRTVRVTTSKGKAFPGGISASGLITLSGGMVDSYNSCNGPYSVSNRLGTNATVATNSQLNPAIKVGTNHVYGHVNTGALGTVNFTGGAVGDVAWNATSSGIQPGWGGNDMNVAFPPNAPPAGGPFFPPPVDNSGGSNITLLGNGTYQMASFTTSLNATKPMFVTGNATLYVVGNVNIAGTGYIKVFPGASLTLIVGGATTISGGGVINGTGVPGNFSLIGLPTATIINYSGSAEFVGTVNAPQAAMTLNGSSGVFGAAIVKTYLSNGSGSFHYDECLGAPSKFLTITSWREL